MILDIATLEEKSQTYIDSLAKTEVQRLKIVSKIENEFLKSVKHKMKKLYIESVPEACGESSSSDREHINIWTVIVYPDDEECYENIPLVCIHGFTAGLCMWTKLMDTFSAKRICYFIDVPGFAKSSRPKFDDNDQKGNMERLLAMLDSWRQAVGIKTPFGLVGHSFGAYIAMAYAVAFPQHANNIVLIEPWGIYDRKGTADDETASVKHKLKRKSKIYLKYVELSTCICSPLTLQSHLRPIRKSLYKLHNQGPCKSFRDVVDRETYWEYFYFINGGRITGENLFRSQQTMCYFAKDPMVKYAAQLPRNITVRLAIGKKSFIYKFNRALEDQLKCALGADRLKTLYVEGYGHHFHGVNCFIDMIGKVSLTDLNDGEIDLFK